MADNVLQAIGFIKRTQNPDGGWGYKPGRMSFVEPTAAVLLALGNDSGATAEVARGREYLRPLQHMDGGWGIAALDGESGWMTAWAVWALAESSPEIAANGVEWLIRTEGLRSTDPAVMASERKVLRIDISLAGWPWQPGDAPWVFPTALALLALSATGHPTHPRASDGVRYLVDRAVPSGGWNVGSPFMFDSQVPATIVDTSLVLIALQRLGVAEAAADKAEAELDRRMAHGGTSAELAWSGWAMRERELPAAPMLARLRDLQREDGSWDSNPFTTAAALLALR